MSTNSRISAIYCVNIRFSFASVYFSPCPISPSLIHLLPILINYICLKFQATVSGSFWGKKLHLKWWFQAKNFWPAAMSSEESKESLTYDEVTSWRSDALKLYCRQRGLKVSGSKQELVARVFDFTPGIICISITRWAPPVSMWLPYFFGLKRQTEMDLQTLPVRRRNVCAPFLQTKQPCSPSKSRRWFGKHLSSIKVVAL